jgi:hypothetical protein
MPKIAKTLSVVDDFYKFLESAKEEAVILTSPPTGHNHLYFFPEDKLRGYLTEQRIRRFLDYYRIDATWYRSIKKSHLIVFAILIRIGKGAYILQFLHLDRLADDRLPIRNECDLPDDCKGFFDAFYEEQWLFSAQYLREDRLNDTCFDDKQIVPITKGEALKVGIDSCTYKTQIYGGYNELLDQVSMLSLIFTCTPA